MKQTKKGRLEVKQKGRQTTSTELAENEDGINAGTNKQGARNNKYYTMTREEADVTSKRLNTG